MERQRMGDGAQIKRKEKYKCAFCCFLLTFLVWLSFFFGKTYPSGFYKGPVYYGRKSRNKSIPFGID
jgi:hypothetical protein